MDSFLLFSLAWAKYSVAPLRLLLLLERSCWFTLISLLVCHPFHPFSLVFLFALVRTCLFSSLSPVSYLFLLLFGFRQRYQGFFYLFVGFFLLFNLLFAMVPWSR